MRLLELLLMAFAAITAGTALAAALSTLWQFRKRPAPTDEELARAFPSGLPRVSLFKPCKGADPSLYENLASFARQDGVPFEMLIGVADPNDPAAAVARRLIADFPRVDIRLVITGDKHLHNPKVINLTLLEPHATGDFFYVADSNVRAKPGLLRRLILPFADEQVALSYAMFRGIAGRSLGGKVQSAIFATLATPSIASAYALFGVGNLVGKSFILRRSALEAIGGFKRYDRYLVEDALIGADIRKAGFKTVLSNEIVDVHLGEMSMKFVWLQEMRWSVLHKMEYPSLPIGEMVWNPFFISLLGAAAWAGGMKLAGVALFAAAIHNQLIDLIPYVRFGGRVRDLWLLVLGDALMMGVVSTVWFHSDVIWRGQKFTLAKHTRIVAAHKVAPALAPVPVSRRIPIAARMVRRSMVRRARRWVDADRRASNG